MASKLHARFECTKVAKTASGSEEVEMSPVMATDEDHPNHKFWEASPSGRLKLRISEKGGQGFFEPGQEYDLTFTPTSGDHG